MPIIEDLLGRFDVKAVFCDAARTYMATFLGDETLKLADVRKALNKCLQKKTGTKAMCVECTLGQRMRRYQAKKSVDLLMNRKNRCVRKPPVKAMKRKKKEAAKHGEEADDKQDERGRMAGRLVLQDFTPLKNEIKFYKSETALVNRGCPEKPRSKKSVRKKLAKEGEEGRGPKNRANRKMVALSRSIVTSPDRKQSEKMYQRDVKPSGHLIST